MNKISFDNGMKSFTINDDENCVIWFNPSDANIYNRFCEFQNKIKEIIPKINATPECFTETDLIIKKELDVAIGNCISKTVFGNTNCLSIAGGQPIIVNFLEAIAPLIKKEIEAEQKASKIKMKKYIDSVKVLK